MARKPKPKDKNKEDASDKVRLWRARIKASDKETEKWEKRGDEIKKRYRDERNAVDMAVRRFNILWSNVQTLRPALYGRMPVPIVERRFLDRDEVGKVASQILERCLRYEMEPSKFHGGVKKSILDYLLPGRGTTWVRYVPVIGAATSVDEDGESESDDPDADVPNENADAVAEKEAVEETAEQPAERLLTESVKVDYIQWKDFYTSPGARIWDEVEWIARKVYMGRDALVKRFGAEIGEEVTLDHSPDEKPGQQTDNIEKQAAVWEAWHKPTRKAVWFANSYDDLLDERDDPLNLDEFWPVPEPLYATLDNESLIPTPDFIEYQDQAREIDELTRRLANLEKSLKVAGCYDASAKGLERVLDEGVENQLIPVNAWAAFAEKGGLQGAIAFLPIKEIMEVMKGLYEAREVCKQDLYEITGIADIIRGNTDPDETLGAQKLKGQYASIRLHERQRDVAQYCRNIIAIMGEIVAEHFSDKTLIEISSVMELQGVGPDIPKQPKAPQIPPVPPGAPPEAQQQAAMAMQQAQAQQVAWQQAVQAAIQAKQELVTKAIALLRQDKMRGFRIDIETDSTIEAEASEEKTQRTEFIAGVTSFMQQAVEVTQIYPQAAPLLGKLLLFGVRGFRVGRDLESAIEEFVDKSEQDIKEKMANAANNPQPNPEMIKAEAEMAKSRGVIEAARIEAESERTNATINAEKAQMEAAYRSQEHEQRMKELAWNHEYVKQDHEARMAELAAKYAIHTTPKPAPANTNAA